MRKANFNTTSFIYKMAKSLCLFVFAMMTMMYPACVEGQRITEDPSSLLLTVNEIGNFTCRAHCDHLCFGQWVIDNETIQNAESNSVPSKLNEKGFTFLEFNPESQENEYGLRLSVNASKANNNSVIQCQYYNHYPTAGVKSRFATVLVISNKIQFSSSAVNASVLFKSDGIPTLVEVDIQLPEALCSFQQVLSFILYSLRVEDIQGSFTYAGPFSNITSCTVRRLIEPDLKESESYTLTVVVRTQSQNIISYKHSFNTSLVDQASMKCNVQKGTESLFSYQLIVIVSLGLAVFLLFSILTIVLLCVCISHKRRVREKRVNNTKTKLCKNMVHNPLYDRSGPEYEIVPPRLESSTQFTLPTIDEARATRPANLHYDTINTPRLSSRQDTPTADTDHYVDQPLHNSSKFRSTSYSSNAHIYPPYDIISRSASSPMPAPSLMGLKKNGQERNKLHLTLSLGKANPIVGTNALGNNHEVAASDSDDNYTILNPTASRQNVGCNFIMNARRENSVLYND